MFQFLDTKWMRAFRYVWAWLSRLVSRWMFCIRNTQYSGACVASQRISLVRTCQRLCSPYMHLTTYQKLGVCSWYILWSDVDSHLWKNAISLHMLPKIIMNYVYGYPSGKGLVSKRENYSFGMFQAWSIVQTLSSWWVMFQLELLISAGENYSTNSLLYIYPYCIAIHTSLLMLCSAYSGEKQYVL